jgi:tRNA(Ile)-lysidine synthase
MALALFARDWARDQGVLLTAFIVDHGLRDEARAEALGVQARLETLGIAAEVLHAPGPQARPTRDIQAHARDLRYHLLLRQCRAQGIDCLALAHHMDDQAETFLLRLARGSGVDGLSAMAPATDWGGVRLLRPMLQVPKSALLARLRDAGVTWVEDPSNQDTRFARVQVRLAQDSLRALGLTPQRLAGTAARMGRARAALDQASSALIAASVREDPTGFALVDRATLCGAPEEVALRALARLVGRVGGRLYPPRLDRLERAFFALRDEGARYRGSTLAGVVLRPMAGNCLMLCREAAGLDAAAPVASEMLWDGRFVMSFAQAAPEFEVRALGRAGWRHLRRLDPQAGRRGEALPGPVRVTLPAIWQGRDLAFAPHLQSGGALIDACPRPHSLHFAGPQPFATLSRDI